MNHKLKTRILKTLEVLPHRMGDFAYHKMQDAFNPHNIAHSVEKSKESYLTIKSLLTDVGMGIEGKTILEIGSGWMPVMPYFFLYEGKAAKVVTYDINQHYHPARIRELNGYFADTFGHFVKTENGKYPVPKELVYLPNTPQVGGKLAPQSVDIVFSRFVLEHVPPDALREMHQQAKRYLKPGGKIVHLISPSDHRAYSDKSICLWDFLQYSNEEWDKIQTRFDYHNRLRMPHFVSLFKETGWEVETLKSTKPKNGGHQHIKFQKLKVDPGFAHFDETELTAGNLRVVLTNPHI